MNLLACEAGVSSPATVAPGLGYPNNRVANSPQSTGWLATNIHADGLTSASENQIQKIQK